jgi:hypothetical protein
MTLLKLRKHHEEDLEEKLFVVDKSQDIVEVFVLLSGDIYVLCQYSRYSNENSWGCIKQEFPTMRLALQSISERFKKFNPGFVLEEESE